jgi:hypothetical protein
MSDTQKTYNVNLFPYTTGLTPITTEGSETVGVCFSGGGSRALSAAMGQLRGLTHLGLIEKTQSISGVSGGAWASTVYSYVPESISEDDLLGEVCEDPKHLTWNQHKKTPIKCALNHVSTNNIGHLPQGMGVAKFAEESIDMLNKGIPEHEIWVRLVGKHIFKPYGLYEGYGKSKFFTSNRDWFKTKIKPHNNDLSEEDFYYLPNDRYRPNLLIFGNMIPCEKQGNRTLLPIEFSPNYSGIMAEFKNTGDYNLDIGGGGIDSFAMNTTDQKYAGPNLQTVDAAVNQFSLNDMAGISSSFFAEKITSEYSEFDSLIPTYKYWPVLNPDSNKAETYGFADGGNMDNSGVASMLRQNLQNIISFLNTSVALDYDKELDLVMVDNQVPPLFGFQPYTKGHGYVPYKKGVKVLNEDYEVFRENHVFDSTRFEEYRNALWKAHSKCGTAMSYQYQLKVCDNPKFGVKAGVVNMLWVYNNKVKTWSKKLKPSVKLGMFLQFWLYSDFPNYPTVNLGLNRRQVNLLAHLSCWNIISENTLGNPGKITNQAMFQRMYQKK